MRKMALCAPLSALKINTMIRHCRLSAPLFALLALLGLGACDPISLSVGAGAATGVAAYQERGIEGVARDAAIEGSIFALWAKYDPKIASTMSIEVYESRALLSGVASNDQVRADIVGLAWKVDGIKDVINEILIGKALSVGEIARDVAITAELKTKLTFDGDVMAVNYTIETLRRTVFLIGIAQNQAELDHVIARARDTSYVMRVVSYVRVKDQARGDGT